jgi:hypothetical protein
MYNEHVFRRDLDNFYSLNSAYLKSLLSNVRNVLETLELDIESTDILTRQSAVLLIVHLSKWILCFADKSKLDEEVDCVNP